MGTRCKGMWCAQGTRCCCLEGQKGERAPTLGDTERIQLGARVAHRSVDGVSSRLELPGGVETLVLNSGTTSKGRQALTNRVQL